MKTFIYLIVILVGTQQEIIQTTLNRGWKFRQAEQNLWFPANVPSTFHLDMIDKNLINDPYIGLNQLDMYRFELLDWEYSLDPFQISDEILQKNVQYLIFEGLDTYADVTLNGKNILNANNMHRTWKIDVTGLLKSQNSIDIYFHSAAKHDLEQEQKNPTFNLPANYSYSRKAAYQYGWDWGPRLVTAGIWKNVKILAYDIARINNYYVRTLNLIDEFTALIEHVVEIEAINLGQFSVVISQINSNVSLQEYLTIDNLKLGSSQIIRIKQIVDKVELWWPIGLGEQKFYNFQAELKQLSGKTIDIIQIQAGIRKIEWVQNIDEIGTSLYAKVNGKPFYMKGGNYIPPDMFMPRALKNPQVYIQTISDAVAAGYNTLRLWGGGQFEYDEFYTLCDQHGLLIWHDLMFACAFYPGDQDFLDNVAAELNDNIKRIRSHPSIAMWNGNNEVEIGWKEWGWKNGRTPQQIDEMQGWYDSLFLQTIPNVLKQIDPDTFYWPTSPSSSYSERNSGDIHFWGVWAGRYDIEDYKIYIGRFNSEYGQQASCDPTSIQKFTSGPSDWNWDSDVIKIHERHPEGMFNLDYYIESYFKQPNGFLNKLYVTQVLQYISLETAITSLRGAKPTNMGSLYWQINDVWPVFSWSTVDFYGCWKAGHYAAKLYHNDPIISVRQNVEKQSQFSFWIVNDSPLKLNGTLLITWMDFYGIIINTITQKLTNIDNSQAYQAASVYLNNFSQLKYQTFLSIQFTGYFSNGTKASFETTYHFVRPLQQDLQQSQLTFEVNSNIISIQSKTLIRNLYIGHPKSCIKLSNNYFDLVPGKKYQIKVIDSSSISLLKDIYFISLWDSYQFDQPQY